MHTGARDLARGEQPGHLGVTVRIGDDTAAAVMRPRHYRDQLDRRIYPAAAHAAVMVGNRIAKLPMARASR